MQCKYCKKQSDNEICSVCGSKLYSNALAYASLKHAGQIRKNGDPYIFHPLKVARYLYDQGYDIRYQVVALLHDVIEDTDATYDDLKNFCDDEMLEAVRLVTKTEGYIEQDYIDAILKHNMAKAVKNSDRINNLEDSLYSGDPEFQKRYIKETIEYYEGNFSSELDDTLAKLVEKIGV